MAKAPRIQKPVLRVVRDEPSPFSAKHLGILLLVTFLVFCRSFVMPYVQWDDNVMIQENLIIHQPFLQALTQSFTRFYHGDYLPMTLMSFWLDLKLFGENPHVQHAVNLFLHLANVSLLYVLLSKLRLRWETVLVICAIFALHPAQAESVYWISERKGLLSTFFLLLGIMASEYSLKVTKRRALWISLYALCYLMAFLAKATGVLLPLWLIIWERLYHRSEWKRTLLRQAPVLVLGAAVSWLRIEAYRASLPMLLDSALSFERLRVWPGMALGAFGFYVRLFVYPIGLSIIYPPFGGNVWDGYMLIGMAGIAAVVYFGLRSWSPWFVVWGLWVFVFLLPVLQVIPRINFVNDRYIYVPLVGFAAIFSIAVWEIKQHAASKWASAAVILLCIVGSFLRGSAWATNENLWSDTVAKAPESGLARNNWALVLQNKGDLAGAVEQYRFALDYGLKDGTDGLALNNLANIYSSTHSGALYNLRQAQSLLLDGIRRAPRPDEAFTLKFNLAMVYIQMNDRVGATRELTDLVQQIQSSKNERYGFLLERAQDLLNKLAAIK